jgi:ADP-ribose pyrophosphatase YjhB (NUDIX family)
VIDDAPILRPAARVLLIDEEDHVLLLRANVGEGDVWITPGGAPEPGETAEQATLPSCARRPVSGLRT